MKFEKRFFFSVIPEWKDQYVALEALIGQIEAVKNAALRLVQSIANIKKLDGNRLVEVDLHAIRPDKVFWEMLDENLQKVDAFYETQLSSFIEQFHALTFQAILLDKMDEYVPFNPGQATKLERELGRLPNNKDIPIGVLGVDEQVHRPLPSSRFFPLTKHSNIDAIKEQLRALKPTLNKLKRSTERKNSPAHLARSHSAVTINGRSSEPPSIEDHLRDFQFASAQLEQSQQRHRDFPVSEGSFGHLHPAYPLSSDSGMPYHQRGPNGTHMSFDHHYPHSHLPHEPHSNNGFESQNHSRISSRSEIEVRLGSDLKEKWANKSQVPPFAVPFQSSDPSLRTHPSNLSREGMPTNGRSASVDWGQDDFFQSSDSDRDPHGAMVHSGSAILQSHRADSEEDLLAMPHVKLHHSAVEMGSTAHHSPPISARSVKKAGSSGYSSFFGSEDELSDREMAIASEEIRASIQGHQDSDETSQASKDSGYDSGNSFEGLEDELHNDEHEEPRKMKKDEDNDTETTGSRHRHVPETRLRTRKNSDAKSMLPVSTSTTELHQMISSGSSSNRNLTQPSPSQVMPPAPSNPLKSDSRSDLLSRSDMDVKPLLSAPNTPVVHKKRRGWQDSVEMSVFNGFQNDPLPLDAEIPDLLPVSDSEELLDLEVENAMEGVRRGDGSEDERVELDLEGDHEPGAPPRTTFYQMPDPRHLNRDKAIKGLQTGFSELYRGMHLLKRYAELNVEATDKVLAKYEKNIARGFRLPYMREEVMNHNFSKGQELRSLISQTEYIYAQAFTDGHRTPAMQKLRVPEEEEDMEATTLRFGLLFGLSLGFALIILYMCIVVRATVVQKMRPDLIVYRMLFIATLMLWYWGVDMWIWSSHRVNYPFIFEFNTRGHMRHQNIFDIASIFTVVLIGDMMLYMLSALQRYDTDFIVPGFEFLKHVPPESYPLVLVILLLSLLLFYSIRSGFWLVRTIGRIVTAPFNKVVFRDFFLADQLVSISLVLQDIDFTICYFTTCAFRGGGNQCATNHVWMSTILSTIPQLWRLLQCLRRYYDSKDVTQLYNAGKYTTGMLVAIASSMRSIVKSTGWLVIWLIFVIVATVYSYGWDIYKDWSIGDRKSANWMLRDQLLYPKWWYYAAAIANLVLRLMWTLTISPDVVAAFFFLGKDGFTTILVSVEVSRRAMWNIFRLENEQLNNCGKFRAVQDIPLPLPLKPAVEVNLYQDKIE